VSERRGLVQALTTLGRSERLACDLVGLGRSSFRSHPPPRSSAEEALQAAVHSLAHRHRRSGYRRSTALLRRHGDTVKATRGWRLWKREGLSLPRQRPHRRHTGPAVALPPQAEPPTQSWTDDCLCDRTASGQLLKSRIGLEE
jgi:putative transposase